MERLTKLLKEPLNKGKNSISPYPWQSVCQILADLILL